MRALCDKLRHVGDQVHHQSAQFRDAGFFDVQHAFVLRQVALLVRRIENAPARGRPVQRVREALKDDEPVFAPVAMPAEGRKRRGMGRVVGAGESALSRSTGESGICETGSRHRQQSADFGVDTGLGLQLADSDQLIECGLAQARLPQVEVSVATGRD